MNKRSCNTCAFAIFQDYGWSNYTVEGTYFFCAKDLHPDNGFDRFYGEDKRLNYGKFCPGYEEGEPIEMDVQEEMVEELTPGQRAIWEEWLNSG